MLEDTFLWMLNCTLRGSLVLVYILLFRLVIRRSSRKWCFILWGVGWFRLLCPWTPAFLQYRNALLPRADWFQKMLLTEETASVAQYFSSRGDVLTKVLLPISGARMEAILRIFSVLWAAGTFVMLVLGIISWLRLSQRLQTAQCVQNGHYSVYACASVQAPFAMGVFHKRIYLPINLTPEEQTLVIAHEQTHLSRNDPLMKLIVSLIRAVHWMNPLVWVAFRLWGSDMEYTCDERVFQWMKKDRIPAYCRALLALSQKPYASCPVAFAEGGIKGRVKNLLRPRKHRVLWGLLSGYLILNLFLLGLTADSGVEAGSVIVSPELRTRLESVVRWIWEDPDRAESIGYFDVFTFSDTQQPGAIFETLDKMFQDKNRTTEETQAEDPGNPGNDLVPALMLFKGEEAADHYGSVTVYICRDGTFSPVYSNQVLSGEYYMLRIWTSADESDYPYMWLFYFQNEFCKMHVDHFSRRLWPNSAEQMLTEMIEATEAAMENP